MLTGCDRNDSLDKSNDKSNASTVTSSEAKLQIISTIKPIQSIVLAIAGDDAVSNQLIPDNASPHDYSFKPSDIRKVQSADVVFRIDEHMESQLNSLFKGLDKNITLVSLAESDGMKLLKAGESRHDDHNGGEHNEYDKYGDHESINTDFHIWTSPSNAILIAAEIARHLSLLDEKNAKRYQQNLELFSQTLNDESIEVSKKLMTLKTKPYIVFHNSWQYFAEEFGLAKPAVVDLHEGVSSGAKTVNDIRLKINQENIRCVFYDSSVSEARLKLLTKIENTTKIDVLAKELSLNQMTYITWLHQLSKQVESCLSR